MVDVLSDALIAYVTWDRVVPWKVLSLPEAETGDFVPIGYGSNQPVFRKRAVAGTVLWVITMPRAEISKPPRWFSPSVVARIRVKGLHTMGNCPREYLSPGLVDLLRQWCWVAVSDHADSRFFELNDSTPALKTLLLNKDARTALETLPASARRRELVKRARFIRFLPNGLSEAQSAFAPCLKRANDRTVFISYTHAGGRSGGGGEEFALDLAEELLRNGFSPWLDALAIPRYDPQREDDCSPVRLERLIAIGLRQSNLAISVVTDDYTRNLDQCKINWTQKEYESILARKTTHGKFRCVQIMRGGKELAGFDRAFYDPSARELSDAVAEWWQREVEPGELK
ncbi:MAG: toll/interleukin-1 receptor domain-containing protein [Desulfobacterales bacterium]|nr:MAG: toll/interleukin-1 receptor domain-containing protein [Desulfobacterales bacterium]